MAYGKRPKRSFQPDTVGHFEEKSDGTEYADRGPSPLGASRHENRGLYQALEHYPAGSLGRSYWEYCRKNDFPLPGEKGGAAEQILFHDCAHVLSGYGTTPDEEVRVACFSAGFQRGDPWTFVFFVLLQFHLGVQVTPITGGRTGFFDPAKAMAAIRCGAAMIVDLSNGWDYWPVMGEQVEELRRAITSFPSKCFCLLNINGRS